MSCEQCPSLEQQLGPPRRNASPLGSDPRPRGGVGAAHWLRGLPGRPEQVRSGSLKGGGRRVSIGPRDESGKVVWVLGERCGERSLLESWWG